MRWKRDYDLSPEDVESVIKSQNNSCKICNKVLKKIYIDHCHITNKVRGLLCCGCNTALGKFNDDPTLLQKAISYLKGTL